MSVSKVISFFFTAIWGRFFSAFFADFELVKWRTHVAATGGKDCCSQSNRMRTSGKVSVLLVSDKRTFCLFVCFFFFAQTNKNSLYLGSNKLTSVSENISRFKSLRVCVRCFSVIFFTFFFLGLIWRGISWRVFQLASESWNNFKGECSILLISLCYIKVRLYLDGNRLTSFPACIGELKQLQWWVLNNVDVSF